MRSLEAPLLSEERLSEPSAAYPRRTPIRGALDLMVLLLATLALTAGALQIAFASIGYHSLLMVSTPPPQTAFRVLLAGYGAFGNHSINPAQLAAEALNGTCAGGVCFESWVMPVNTAGASRVASALLARASALAAPWDAIIHIGLEASSKGLRIETAASNVKATVHTPPGSWSADVPCNKTGTQWAPIDVDAPCLLAATLPLDELALDEDGPVELWSRDAGAYYCNEALFRTVAVVRSQRVAPATAARRLLPVTFIHLPTLNTSSLATSVAFISHVAGLMVGRDLPSPSRAELLIASAGDVDGTASLGSARLDGTDHGASGSGSAATPLSTILSSFSSTDGAACDAPNGEYSGSAAFAGVAVKITAVATRDGRLRSGTMELSVDARPILRFACEAERWRLQASDILVVEDACWRSNVQRSIHNLSMVFDATANAIELHGTHRMWLVDVPLDLTLPAKQPCKAR